MPRPPSETSLDPSAIVPERVITGRARRGRGTVAAWVAEGALSLALNVGLATALVHFAFSTRAVSEPQAIAVDLVPDVPKGSGADPKAGKREQSSAGVGASPGQPASPVAPAETSAPAQDPKSDSDTPPGAAAASATDEAQPGRPEHPASVDRGQDPAPRLVEAPAAPQQAAEQTERNLAANAETKPADTPKPVERPPPPAPPVATATHAAESVAEPARTAETDAAAPTASPEAEREADNTAKLAAALPYAQSFALDMHRAALSSVGQTDSAKYRGEVYAAFRRADDLVEAARAKHLKGQAVIEFSIDDRGALTGQRVAVSSGDPAVDETAMAMIRQSAPFPPPPPGAQRTFSPAIRLGLDEQ